MPRSALGPALGPRALDHLAFAVETCRAGTSLQLTVAPEVSIRITQLGEGVSVALQGGKMPGATARAELEALVEGLRTRGIRVAMATVAPSGRAAR